MALNAAHFCFDSDDLEASRRFYERVFGWPLDDFGPPGAFRLRSGSAPASPRTAAPPPPSDSANGQLSEGAELAISVADLAATRATVLASGGRILLERSLVPGVGHLIAFEDPAGNPLLAVELDDRAH